MGSGKMGNWEHREVGESGRGEIGGWEHRGTWKLGKRKLGELEKWGDGSYGKMGNWEHWGHRSTRKQWGNQRHRETPRWGQGAAGSCGAGSIGGQRKELRGGSVWHSTACCGPGGLKGSVRGHLSSQLNVGREHGTVPPPRKKIMMIKLPSSHAGVDFKMKTIEVDGIKVRIQIW